jgi:impB/mucB/samB family C-terminal domain
MNFVDSLPTRKVGGVGKVLEKMLHSFNLMTMKDVRENMETVLFSFTPASADFLLHTTLGVAINEGKIRKDIIKLGDVSEDIGRKSLGAERTFSLCCELYSDQKNKLKELCQKVSNELKEKNLWGKTVTLKVKTTKFELFTRSLTNKNYFQNSEIIEKIAYQLLETVIPIKIRLIGVTISKFISKKSSIHFPSISTCSSTLISTSSSSSSSSSSTTSSSSSLIKNYFTSTEEKVKGIQHNDIQYKNDATNNANNKKDENYIEFDNDENEVNLTEQRIGDDNNDSNDCDDNIDCDINNDSNDYDDSNNDNIYNNDEHGCDDNNRDNVDGDDDNVRIDDYYDDYCYGKCDRNNNEHNNNNDNSSNNNNDNNNNDNNSSSSSSRLNNDSGDSTYEDLHNHNVEVRMEGDRGSDSVDISQRRKVFALSPTASSAPSASSASFLSSNIPPSNDIVSSTPFTPSSSTSYPTSSSSSISSSSSLISSSSSSSHLSSRLTLTQQQHFPCPICHKTVYGTLLALNMHIDQCLLVGSSIPHSLGKNLPCHAKNVPDYTKNVTGHAKNVLSLNNVMYHIDEAPTSTSNFDYQERKNVSLKNKRFNGDDNFAISQAAKKTKNRHQNIRPKEVNVVGNNSNRITNFLYHDTKKC